MPRPIHSKEEILQSAGETIEYARQYARQQVEYYRLEFAEKSAKTTAGVITGAIVASILLLSLLMLSIAAGLFLGTLLNSYVLAFLCLSGFYIIVAIGCYVTRQKLITNPVLSTILNTFLN